MPLIYADGDQQSPQCQLDTWKENSKTNQIYLQEVHPLECLLLRMFGSLSERRRQTVRWLYGPHQQLAELLLLQLKPLPKLFFGFGSFTKIKNRNKPQRNRFYQDPFYDAGREI